MVYECRSKIGSAEDVFTHGTHYVGVHVEGCGPYGWGTLAPAAELVIWRVQRADSNTTDVVTKSFLATKKGPDSQSSYRYISVRSVQFEKKSLHVAVAVPKSTGASYPPSEVTLWITADTGDAIPIPLDTGDNEASLRDFEVSAAAGFADGPPALLYRAALTMGALIPDGKGGYELDERLVMFPAGG